MRQHAERRKFFTHSGAVIHAVRIIRRTEQNGGPRVEWYPVPARSRVHDTRSDEWIRACELPTWQGD